MVRSGKTPDLYAYTVLLKTCKNGQRAMNYHREMLFHGVVPDVRYFTALLSVCSGSPQYLEYIYQDMKTHAVKPDAIVADMFLAAASPSPELSSFFLEEMRRHGHTPSLHTYHRLMAASGADAKRVERLFRELCEKVAPDTIAFNHMLRVARTPEAAWDVLGRMKAQGVPLNSYTMNFFLRACKSSDEALDEALQEVRLWGIAMDVSTYNSLLAGCVSSPDALRRSRRYYREMMRDGVAPNNVTFLAMMRACAGDPFAAEDVLRLHRSHHLPLQANLFSAYVVAHRDRLFECTDALLRALKDANKDAAEFFEDLLPRCDDETLRIMIRLMKRNNVPPHLPSLMRVVGAYHPQALAETFEWIESTGGVPEHSVGEFIALMKCASPDGAKVREAAMRESVSKCLTAFHGLLCVSSGRDVKVEEIVRQMATMGVAPNATTVAIVMEVSNAASSVAQALVQGMKEQGMTPPGRLLSRAMHGHATPEACFSLFLKMCELGVRPGASEYLHLIERITGREDMIRRVLAMAEADQSLQSANALDEKGLLKVYTKLISASRGHTALAHEIFERLEEWAPPDVVVFQALIESCGRDKEEAMYWLQEMRARQVVPDVDIYNQLILSCGSLGEGCHFVQECQRAHLKPTHRTFVNLLRLCDGVADAKRVHRMIHGNRIAFSTVLYNGLIRACVRDRTAAEHYFAEMQERLLAPNTFTFNCLMQACRGEPERCLQYYERMKKEGVPPNKNTLSVLIEVLGSEVTKHISFDEMLAAGVEPDEVTFTLLIRACGATEGNAALFLNNMIRRGLVPNVHTYNALISSCRGEWRVARKIYQAMLDVGVAPDVVTLNAMIRACGRRIGAMKQLVADMRARGVKLNERSYVCLIRASDSLDGALRTFGEALEAGLPRTTELYNALIGRCGRQLSKATELVEEMRTNNVPCDVRTYTYLMQSCGVDKERALEYYREMRERRVEPDALAFLTIGGAFGGEAMLPAEVKRDVERYGMRKEVRMLEAALKACDGDEERAVHFYEAARARGWDTVSQDWA